MLLSSHQWRPAAGDLVSNSPQNAQSFSLSHDNKIPEAESDDRDVPEDNGYAESKYVAERL